jgi:ribosomal protein S18 acetylase RimI-like enzyme
MSDVEIKLGGRSVAEELFEPMCRLYDAVFSRPPFHWTDRHSEQHRARLRRLMDDPSFGIATAEADDDLIGFAYGAALGVDTRWWTGFLTPLPEELTTEREGRTFALVDLAVREDRRGRGIARRLLDALLGSRREERATLSVQPVATGSQAMYEHLGWRKVGRVEGVAGESAPFYDVYLLPLHPRP